MPYTKKSNTKLTVDQILDGAADVLQQSGWVTGHCHDSETGGHCAIGAMAMAVYPRANGREVEDLAYVGRSDQQYRNLTGRNKDPRLVEAVQFLGKRVDPDTTNPGNHYTITDWNDDHPNGKQSPIFNPVTLQWDRPVDEKIRRESSRKVVRTLRAAAKAYRKQQAKAAA